MPVVNCGPTEMTIPRGTHIGLMETIHADGAIKVDEGEVAAKLAAREVQMPAPPSAERRQQILQELTLTVPSAEKQKYIDLIMVQAGTIVQFLSYPKKWGK